MPAEMRILGWKAAGLRCPDHDVTCCDQDDKPFRVSLVQMPNGTGKTTTLALLRAALSGVASGWDRATVAEFRKHGVEAGRGVFEVRLLLNGRRVTVVMNFDFSNGRVHYKTTRGPGQVDGFDPPVEFRRFMNEDFVRFFVFDGELAEHLLDRNEVKANAVVESLFQISSIRLLESSVGEYWQRKTSNASATEERGLKRRQNRLDKLKSWLTTLKRQKKDLEAQRSEVAERLQRQRSTYEKEIRSEEARSQKLRDADAEAKGLEAEKNAAALDVLECMRDPHALSAFFAESIYALKNGLDRVKLPESAAREFFEELAEEDSCICGRPIDDQIRGVIRERAHKYLGTDDVSLLNSMKSDIQEAVGNSREYAESILCEKMGKLQKLVVDEREASNELDELLLEVERFNPEIKKVNEEIESLGGLLDDLDRQLEEFDSKDEADDSRGIAVIASRIKEAEQRLAEISETIELKSRRDVLTRLLQRAYQYARDGISQDICMEANRRILELMPYNNISIKRLERCLVLDGQEGGSAGETLSVAYAFLSTLFHRSEHQLPFVVDSPAGPIDLAIRPKIGSLVPKLTDQFVAFTISSERDGFVGPLKQASNERVQFITLFRKGSGNLDEAARRAPDHVETIDGLVVQGESFFNDFQLDTEVQ